MAIFFHAEEVKFPPIKKRETANWIHTVAKTHGKNIGEISYLFCNDKKILEINRQYLQHDYYTDIITFELSEQGEPVLGEVYISIDRVRDNAQHLDQTFQRELYRVLFHGVLHLCGYKDKSPKEKAQMRAMEEHYLLQYTN